MGELRGCRGVDEKEGVVSETRVDRFGNDEKGGRTSC
jgi:hypothetical protein